MNFDELKNAWADDAANDAQVEIKQIPLDKTSSAIGKIRKNMRTEFFALIISYVLIIFLFIRFSKPQLSFIIGGTALFLLLVQSTYYFVRFYFFYKKMNHYDMSLRKTIRKIVYETELNIEIYRTYSFCAMPLALLTCVAYFNINGIAEFMKQIFYAGEVIRYKPLIYLVVNLVIAQFVSYFFINLHIRMQYGQYVKELKKIMDDIETDE